MVRFLDFLRLDLLVAISVDRATHCLMLFHTVQVNLNLLLSVTLACQDPDLGEVLVATQIDLICVLLIVSAATGHTVFARWWLWLAHCAKILSQVIHVIFISRVIKGSHTLEFWSNDPLDSVLLDQCRKSLIAIRQPLPNIILLQIVKLTEPLFELILNIILTREFLVHWMVH